ncbi:MAG TPA: hypothetical protein VJU87_11285, partial [Gemmatimonadaceae bacterium]|nr:hypothetical protein [Gemmatimonadaceae bacterium]
MPQLDRLLSVMVSNRAETLMLDEGELAKLELGGNPRPVTKSPLTAVQIIGLLREIAPPEAARHLDATRPATFTYASSDGAFTVRAMLDGGKWRVRIGIDGEADLHRALAPQQAETGRPTPLETLAAPAAPRPPR